MIKPTFDEMKKNVIEFLSKSGTMVLATCSNNRVTARTITYASKDLIIYFQTDKDFLKYKQIEENSNVALCTRNLQIEGVAKIKGHPYDEENALFRELFEKHHNGSFQMYSHVKNEVVIEINPKYITIWDDDSDSKKSYRDFINVEEGFAERNYYDPE